MDGIELIIMHVAMKNRKSNYVSVKNLHVNMFEYLSIGLEL